ncbi:hypothetical protein BB559_002078 [Furculomyces boomerangus]|uniref:Trehalase n=2 Tax=Harpellales TaxID=61421 RepID=A0A2T9YYC4_9FUNG|nr:hypothetical protein BB559_002078 [Furculomyces boomerangus]PWA00472.1 hypothetical protein BB558_003497 [Smittium angustum]
MKIPILTLICSLFKLTLSSQHLHSCDSKIFCNGPILRTVQLSGVFPDDKTFVDKPTIKPSWEVIAAFKKLGNSPSKQQILNFVNQNFGHENSLLKSANLSDWKSNPRFISKIKSPYLAGFAKEINSFWKELVKVQDKSSLCDGCESTFLDIEGIFIVPGGRFREFYYWDTYFTLEGMLKSELFDTSKEVIEILLGYVQKYGFVPNGARQYYFDRSQPPLLAHMVDIYYKATNDIDFIRNAHPILIKEHDYWMDKHTVGFREIKSNRDFRMFRYIVNATAPRPEGYSVDYYIAHNATSDPESQKKLYVELLSGAESGYDYSSRWVKNTTLKNPEILSTLAVTDIIPSDLNAIMYNNQKIISDLSKILAENTQNKDERNKLLSTSYIFEKLKDQTFRNIINLLFDKETGMFNDYSIKKGSHTGIWSIANAWPYWYFADLIDEKFSSRAWENIDQIIKNNSGGIPVSLIDTGLQWDYPDAWPPLQYTTIKGLLLSSEYVKSRMPQTSKKYRQMALTISNQLVGSAFCAWYKTGGSIPGLLKKLPGVEDDGHIFEKFNSTDFGNPAGGGEYTVQAGFGWTNGIILWLMDMFGQELVTPSCFV